MDLKHQLLPGLLALFLLVGCTREIPVRRTVVHDGKVFEMGASEPFTGIVTGKAAAGNRSEPWTYHKVYRDGVLNGDSRFWHPNGRLASVEPYRDGRINGILTRYDENGKIRSRVHLVDGLRGGEHGEFFFASTHKDRRYR